jgi:hypothetical protein
MRWGSIPNPTSQDFLNPGLISRRLNSGKSLSDSPRKPFFSITPSN